MEANKKTYSSKKVIEYYNKYESLQKPEQTIFNLLKTQLPGMKMLDIGIGAGRTTRHFGPYVKEYVGIDYSGGMVEACKKKFQSEFPGFVFAEADVRKLELYSENEFDFVLFSFNGIDYMTADERFLSLKQIRRVLKPGGVFCFSSHNIQSLDNSSKFQFRFNLPALFKQMITWQKVKRMNKSQFEKLETSEFVRINDGVHDFGLETHYYRPVAQEKMLTNAGFKNIRFFSLETGFELKSGEAAACKDRWIYYFCDK